MRDPDPSSVRVNHGPDVSIGRLKRRADFLRAAKGRRWHGKAFSLQAAPESDASRLEARVGFTVTKKVGGSVVRNRARRRLREALRLARDLPVLPGHDYVVIARAEALRLPFKSLKSDLSRAIRGVHTQARPRDTGKRAQPVLPPDAPTRTTQSP